MIEPGKIIKNFTSKKGNEVVLRYPQKEDVSEMLRFINELSKEDTYIMFSGEQLSMEEEIKYLEEVLDGIEKGIHAHILAFFGNKLIGGCEITKHIRRMSHVGIIHISVAKDFREEGIGKEMLLTIIEEGKRLGLKMLGIEVFANNEIGLELYKKVGFIEHGRFPKAVQFKGELVDKIEMHMEI